VANTMYLRGMTLCNIRHTENVRGPRASVWTTLC